MRLLVVGAGASYAEALEVGVKTEFRPPMMANFAAQMWTEYSPHDLLASYLHEIGHPATGNPRSLFLALEADVSSGVNIERFFAYAYHRRDWLAPGPLGMEPMSQYQNLLLHGIIGPLTFLLCMGLLRGGPETAYLPLSSRVARRVGAGDVILNLNYDTIFEVAARQVGHDLVFLPNRPDGAALTISKPHGSINLFVDEERGRFRFSSELFAGALQPADGSRNYLGLVPPRLGKQYDQHPVAAMILDATSSILPDKVTFWGVGLTESDCDLLELFRKWCRSADVVEFINPSSEHVAAAARLLRTDVVRFESVAAWEAGIGVPVVGVAY